MKTLRFRPRRYRLKQITANAVSSGHPWIFRDKVSKSADKFADGQWLELLDPHEKIVGYGIYLKEGGVAIRMLREGPLRPDIEWLHKQVRKALKKREGLRQETDAYRLFNGENDGLPGVVLDVYQGYGVLQTYHPAVDSLGRYLAALVYPLAQLKGLLWKCPQKRIGGPKEAVRLLRGEVPTIVTFREGPMTLAANLWAGQKSGTFLDLRGLRRWLSEQTLAGQKVLNLFAYTGMAGLACAQAGAREVLNVDAAQASLDFGQRYHNAPAQRWLTADIFPWMKNLGPQEKYDLIVVDPPSMASQKDQVFNALATYKRIYRGLIPHLKPGGKMVACCCTSRISPDQFELAVRESLPTLKVRQRLTMEVDHKPRFAEANYLKVIVLQ